MSKFHFLSVAWRNTLFVVVTFLEVILKTGLNVLIDISWRRNPHVSIHLGAALQLWVLEQTQED